MEKILIVDDEINVRRALIRILRGPGRQLDTASNGNEALDMMVSEDYNLVISDLKMPELDGIAFLEQVTIQYPAVSQILVSGHADLADLGHAISRCELTQFIAKPWQTKDLTTKVEQTLRENRQIRKQRHAVSELNQELSEAASLQLKLLPAQVNNKQCRIEWLYKPCSKLGGDGFGYRIENNQVSFFLIDVAGHGTRAAMESFALQNMLANKDFTDPAAVAAEMNQHYLGFGDSLHYFTMIAGRINLATGEMVYCQAGHPSPVIINGKTRLASIKPGSGYPIGLVTQAEYANQTNVLAQGDAILLFSDGFFEGDGKELELALNQMSADDDITSDGLLNWRLSVSESIDDISAIFLERK